MHAGWLNRCLWPRLPSDNLPAIPPMSPAIYHILHIVGLICVFVGFGALLSQDSYKSAMKWHGIGLLIMLISGFGWLAKVGKTLPEGAQSPYTYKWVLIKMALWLVLGFLPVLAKRRVLASHVVVLIAVLAGATLAYLGYMKPIQ